MSSIICSVSEAFASDTEQSLEDKLAESEEKQLSKTNHNNIINTQSVIVSKNSPIKMMDDNEGSINNIK